MRLAVAAVWRLAAEGLPPGALRSPNLRTHFLVFLDDTRALLASGAHGARNAAPRPGAPLVPWLHSANPFHIVLSG